MSARELEVGLASLSFARRMTLKLLDGTPEDHWFHIPIPSGNHAAWIAGHVAWEDDDLLKSLVKERGSKLPQAWHDGFGQGSVPAPNPADYPSITELHETLASCREDLIDFFISSVDQLRDPLPEKWHTFAKDLSSMMHGVSAHEMLHAGQLTVIRKSLKLDPIFG